MSQIPPMNEPETKRDKRFEDSVRFGVADDVINYRKLFFWSAIGTAVVAVVVTVIINIYDTTMLTASRKAAEKSVYYDIGELREKDQARLGSYGLVDAENGIYRIPVDSAITLIVEEP